MSYLSNGSHFLSQHVDSRATKQIGHCSMQFFQKIRLLFA